jgi:NAD(P)-dependent dehydrogenase (short-subunit alcohol dehydrogenase family)
MLMTAESYLKGLFGLHGRTAVVIGGTGVLGSALCESLACAGAHTVVVGRDRGRGEDCVHRLTSAGASAEFVVADCTSRKDLDSLVAHLTRANRAADVLVNAAGINAATPFLEISEEEWDRVLNVNLRGVRLGCQVFGKYMIQRSTRGSIINVASLSGITPLSRVFTYSATKAAVINLTENLAREWAPLGIRVNALSPGFFPAEQNKAILTEERIDNVMRHTPLKRFGLPKELAGAILMLASPNAGSFVTGTNIVVDGGFSSMTI